MAVNKAPKKFGIEKGGVVVVDVVVELLGVVVVDLNDKSCSLANPAILAKRVDGNVDPEPVLKR